MLTLSVLGPLHCELNGVPITRFRSVKNQALLVYLVLNAERPQPRTRLAHLLWPAESEERARLNLRQALFQLRSLLAGEADPVSDYLLTTADSVQFNRQAPHTVDALAFAGLLESCARHSHARLERCAECAARLEQAVALYRGDFLQGMFVDESAELEEWLLWRRQQGQQQLLQALHTLAAWHEQRGEDERVCHYAERQLANDALSEEAYQQLIGALARLGRRQEALAHYERCRRVLRAELGVEPNAALQRRYAELKQPVRPRIPAAPAPTPERRPPPALHNLPLAPNRFIGRQQELATLRRQLLDPACRWITLLGPGGVGKTRLALTLAHSLLPDLTPDLPQPIFPDGIWFVALAGVSQVNQVPQVIASALGARLAGQAALRQQLLEYLHSKRLLLVLDNYEHLLAEAGLVDEILQQAAGVKVLITSRERLNFHKEWTYELSGLAYQPTAARSLSEPALAAPTPEGAERLFLERVQRIGHVAATGENLAHVQRICQLVEGYPLGIELAAALLTVMPLADIVQEIEQGLDILTTDLGDIPDRHRSLRAVFDSSWERLRPQERMVGAQLAVFHGGFDWPAAQAVAHSTRLDLAGLVNKSILSLSASGRYQFHELLRRYAWSRQGAGEQVQAAHARYFADFVHLRHAQLQGGGQKQALAELNREIENIRVAWAWAVQQGEAALLQRFSPGLALFWERQGLWEEGESLFAQAVASLQPTVVSTALPLVHLLVQRGRFGRLRSLYEPARAALQQAVALSQRHQLDQTAEGQALVAEALHNLGLLAHLLGDNQLALEQLEAGLARSRTLAQPWLLAEGLNFLARVRALLGQPAAARQLFQEALTLQRALEDLHGMAATMNQLGFLLVNAAEYARAELIFQECLLIQRAVGDQLGVANTLNSLGAAAITQGDYQAAIQHHLESMAIYRQYNDRGGVLRNLGNLGYAYNRAGDYAAALAMSTQALALDREIGSPRSLVFTLRHLGETYLHLHNLPQSRRTYHQALALAQDIAEIPLVLLVLNAMAPLWVAEGELPAAVERLTFVLHHPATEGKVQAQARRQLAEIAGRLDASAVAAAERRGREQSLAEVVTGVLRSG